MRAIKLKTEYLTNPIGIDIAVPRFFWNCEGGTRQTAYQIVASSNGKTVWDSGKVDSNRMIGILYAGKALASRMRIIWKVRLWDENENAGEWSDEASFEMGLLTKTDWKAKWITGDYSPKKKEHYPVDCFRKFFVCETVACARLYITACGLYETHINGRRVGKFIMAPGFTDTRVHTQYQTYDVTDLLKQGENEITVRLADGWYRGSVGAMGIRNVFGKATKLLAQLEVDSQGIITDDSWDWSNDGFIKRADMQDGEVCDLRKKPSYGGRAIITSYNGVLCAANNISVTEHERFTPILSKTPQGKTLLDFRQNIAGYVEIHVTTKDGQKLFMQFAEHLDSAGELDMAAIQCRPGKPNATPKQEIILTCAEGGNHYKTTFAVFGFRYASIETDIHLLPENITAIAIYSDMDQTGDFECSNALINRFVENTLWSMKGNFLDVPTDCPTRERAPWTGDVQIFAKTGTYFMDTAAFFRKWLIDLHDRQRDDGMVPCHAPEVRNNEYFAGIDFIARMDGCCGWADVAVILPWRLYEMYGDIDFLAESYSSMKSHILFQISRTNRTGLFGKAFPKPGKKYISNVGQAFGEWLEAQDVYKQSVVQDFIAPHPEEATAYLSYVCGIMVDVAQLLGHDKDIPHYEEYRDGCKAAYVNQFTPIDTDRQSKLVRPLALNILDGDARKQTFERLVRAIEAREYKIGTGFLSTPLILPLLTKMGRLDIAYKMMENELKPGWLYEVKQGATTVWENWDGIASQNHYSPGSVCEWLFETVCGVKMDGENHFRIAPQPGGTLTYASFSYNSIYGKVVSGWKKENDRFVYTVIVPANTTAEIQLPNGNKENVLAGTYFYTT